ncbi:MAG: M3 family oligoendopeptidase [Thermodesulfobacteriota bacterium]
MSQALNERLATTDCLWRLEDLYHDSADPAIPRDIEWCLGEAAAIRAQWAGRLDGLSGPTLAGLVARLEALAVRLGRLSSFASLRFAVAAKDQAVAAFLQRIREKASEVSRELVFFELEWARLDDERAAALLADPATAGCRHHLANLRRYRSHLLSEAEEGILLAKAPVGRGAWTTLFEKVLGHLVFGPQGRTEEEVLADLYHPERPKRAAAADELTAGLKGQLHILTHIFNTLLADKMLDDRLRRYPTWLASMNLDNELSDRTVEVLVTAVQSRFDIPERYYRAKASLLGLPELCDFDRYAPLPHLPTVEVPWPEARAMVLEAFQGFSPEMGALARRFFDEAWIHAPVLDGKRSGAFAHPAIPEVHPYILVNYTGNLRDVSTVAHELGHGVHQLLAHRQGYFQSQTPLVLAETASVFAELLVFRAQLARLTAPRERLAFIAQKLESIFATVFRQVAMHRFEARVHEARRAEGELTSEAIASHWLATQEEMFRGSVTLREDYGIWWSYIPHFLHTPGYVYAYAFGELLVLALYARYQAEGPAFVRRYLGLLAAGGSRSPYELAGDFGIDLDDPAFWQGGLAIIEGMLAEMEALQAGLA